MNNHVEECLRRVFPFWNSLTGKDRELLLESAAISAYPKGAVVFNPLKKESGVRIILEGQMRISIQTDQGGELLLYQFTSGELCLLSVFSLMKKFNWDIYMETMQESKIIVIPEAVYLGVSGRNPEMERFNAQLLFERMAEVVSMTSEYALASTDKRLAGLLLRYREMAGSDVLTATHEAMARDIGTAREVVSRILKQFETDRLVELGRGKVTILDRAGLESIKYGR